MTVAATLVRGREGKTVANVLQDETLRKLIDPNYVLLANAWDMLTSRERTVLLAFKLFPPQCVRFEPLAAITKLDLKLLDTIDRLAALKFVQPMMSESCYHPQTLVHQFIQRIVADDPQLHSEFVTLCETAIEYWLERLNKSANQAVEELDKDRRCYLPNNPASTVTPISLFGRNPQQSHPTCTGFISLCLYSWLCASMAAVIETII